MKRIFFVISLIFISISAYSQFPEEESIYIQSSSCPTLIPTHFDSIISLNNSPQNEIDVSSLRRLYFVHGLSGSAKSLQRIAEACEDKSLNIPGFPARKCVSTRVDYTNSTGSLSQAARDVRNQIYYQADLDSRLFNMEPASAILIGHSQGGLILRTLEHLNSVEEPYYVPNNGKGYGGMITLGAPLQGTYILNNRNDILSMANDACRQLMKGPNSNILGKIIFDILGVQFPQKTCNLISNTLLPTLCGAYFDSITNFYMVNAPWIDTLNNDTISSNYCNMPKLAVYGLEPSEFIFWRTANWMINEPNDSYYFEANDDWSLFTNIFNTVYTQYRINYNKNISKAEICDIFKEFPIVGDITELIASIYLDKAAKWKAGVDWFHNSDAEWEAIIGAYTPHIETNTKYLCYCADENGNFLKIQQLVNNKEDCIIKNCDNITPITSQTIRWTHKENDGVVLAESAGNLPAMSNPPIKVYYEDAYNPKNPNVGTSHMQMRNDGGIKNCLNNIFDGQYGRYFKTSYK